MATQLLLDELDDLRHAGWSDKSVDHAIGRIHERIASLAGSTLSGHDDLGDSTGVARDLVGLAEVIVESPHSNGERPFAAACIADAAAQIAVGELADLDHYGEAGLVGGRTRRAIAIIAARTRVVRLAEHADVLHVAAKP